MVLETLTEALPELLGGSPQPEGAQLDITCQRRRAKQFGQRAASLASRRIHLEETILGVQVALHEYNVVLSLAKDMWNAIDIPGDFHGRIQAWCFDGSGDGSGSNCSKKYRSENASEN